MRVTAFALATTSILQPCTDSVLEAAASTATGLRAPTVVPALANGHDDISFSRSLRSSVQGISMGGGLLGEGVVNKIESAVSSALVKYQLQEHVFNKPHNVFRAAFPETVVDKTLMKHRAVRELVTMSHYEGIIKTPLSLEDESDLARDLAGLLSSEDEKVQHFGEVHLMVLIRRWVTSKRDPVDVMKDLKLPGRSIYRFLMGDSAEDVVLMKYCALAKPGKGPDLYDQLMIESVGGPENFLRLMSVSFIYPNSFDRSLRIIKASMKAKGVNPSIGKKFLWQYRSASTFYNKKLEKCQSPHEISVLILSPGVGRRQRQLLSLVEQMIESAKPVSRLVL
ncbi:unnamed protein product [Hyaloperonospora brassicae]|uniref:RxLR effector candidate protein n=1 Tax=Hyaloperonospora brassicae TaxID=162125 RepID=A0AAV0UY54_HYABA|nr:unnamed protein product [Hyaloperonospora brassicae]